MHLKPYFTCPKCGGRKTFQGKLCWTCRFGALHYRLWSRIEKRSPDECWPWIGKNKTKEGRGRLLAEGRQVLASRLVYAEIHGDIPDGIKILHTCDFPPCCNPVHLFSGTLSDNAKDAHKKGRLNICKTSPPPLPVMFGKENPAAKLSESSVLDIRSRYRGKLKPLAHEYRVDSSTIWKIVHGLSWRHLLP